MHLFEFQLIYWTNSDFWHVESICESLDYRAKHVHIILFQGQIKRDYKFCWIKKRSIGLQNVLTVIRTTRKTGFILNRQFNGCFFTQYVIQVALNFNSVWWFSNKYLEKNKSFSSQYETNYFLYLCICCGYSKELSKWDGFFAHAKHMLKLMGKKI